MLELHVIFQGKVQGIGFRAAAKRKADELHLTGYVKNLPDGTVELVAQGNEALFKPLLHHLNSLFDLDEALEEYRTISEPYLEFTISMSL